MAACCIVYYSRHLLIYNHNVVMLALGVATADACWQAWRRRSLAWWACIGLTLGLGLITKYQAIATVVCVAVFFTACGAWKERVHRQGALLAALVGLLVVAPHLWWLKGQTSTPLTYAVASSLGVGLDLPHRITMVLTWVSDHFLNRGLGALVLLAAVGWMHRRRAATEPEANAVVDQTTEPEQALIYSFALVPAAFIVLTVLVLGAEARKHWGTPYLIWMVPAVMQTWRRVDWSTVGLGRAAVVFALVQGALLMQDQASLHSARRHPEPSWSQPRAGDWAPLLAQQARQALGGPILLVSGPETFASAFALAVADKPLVYLAHETSISPWVPPGALQTCPYLHLGWGEVPPEGRAVDHGPPGLHWVAVAPPPATGPGSACPLTQANGR